jgi:hypothetical protein
MQVENATVLVDNQLRLWEVSFHILVVFVQQRCLYYEVTNLRIFSQSRFAIRAV